MYRTRIVLLSLGVLAIAAGQVQAALVALNEAGFENAGAGDANVKDNTNYRSWGSGSPTLTAGAGGGVNEGFWLGRGFNVDNLDSGDLRQDAVTGKTGNQFHGYGGGTRGLFQYVAGTFTGDFELKVDVYAPTTVNLATYQLAVVGFDDPSEVSVDIGGNLSLTLAGMITHSGTGGFEVFSNTLVGPGTSGVFNEITLAGTFTDTYDYVGVMLVVQNGINDGVTGSDYVGFDNVRLTLIDPPSPMPEPTTLLLMTVGMAGLGLIRPRRRSRS